jgi:AraC-like DNA-binding protein
LDRLHLHRHSELHALVLGEAERCLIRRSRPLACAERVRGLLSGRPPGRIPDMSWVARELGVSVRSLRRRLSEEGTSYRELTQASLYDAACSMLRNPDVTLQGVAHALGFADASAFHRAFRRWAERTPAQFRAAAAS